MTANFHTLPVHLCFILNPLIFKSNQRSKKQPSRASLSTNPTCIFKKLRCAAQELPLGIYVWIAFIASNKIISSKIHNNEIVCVTTLKKKDMLLITTTFESPVHFFLKTCPSGCTIEINTLLLKCEFKIE